jgi:hypothetical protein
MEACELANTDVLPVIGELPAYPDTPHPVCIE